MQRDNITISRKNLELETELGFAGHIVSQNGIRPDDGKYKAIKEFPAPKNFKDLRSYLGLANQLAAFVPDLAHMSAGLRPLLKKGNAWVWEKEHKEEFSKIKNLLVQKNRKGKLSLIQCGSRSLTPTNSVTQQ